MMPKKISIIASQGPKPGRSAERSTNCAYLLEHRRVPALERGDCEFNHASFSTLNACAASYMWMPLG